MNKPARTEALDLQKKRLITLLGNSAQSQLETFESVQQSLEELCRKYSSRRGATFLNKLGPSLNDVLIFASAVQGIEHNSQVASVLWASIRALLHCVSKFVSTLDKIAQILIELSKTLRRFSKYIDLYPSREILRETLFDLVFEYTSFCISAVEFFKRRPLINLLQLTWAPLKEKFNHALGCMQRQIDDFTAEIHLAHVETNVQGHKETQRLYDASQNTRLVMELEISFPINTVIFQRNPLFVGRDDILQELHEATKPLERPEHTQLRSCVVHGMGGMGKTQIAVEYAYRYRSSFDCIFWLRSETRPILSESFSVIAQKVGLAKDSLDQERNVTQARDWLCRKTDVCWLLIFDNVNDLKLLGDFWPPAAHGSIIVTTQLRDSVYRATHSIDLQSLRDEDCVKLILKYLHRDENDVDSAVAIAHEVGGLPLLVSHIAGYIDQTGLSLAKCLNIILNRSQDMQIWTYDSTTSVSFQYDKALQVVWNIALEALSDEAKMVLNLLAMFGSDEVPEVMFVSDDDNLLVDTITGPATGDFNEIRRSLRSRHLVECKTTGNGPAVSMHRSLKRHILRCLNEDPELRDIVFLEAVTLVRSVFPAYAIDAMASNDGQLQTRDKYFAHVMSLLNAFLQFSPPIKPLASYAHLFLDGGLLLNERGHMKAARKCFETAEATFEQLPMEKYNLYRLNVIRYLSYMDDHDGISTRARGISRKEQVRDLRQEYYDTIEPSAVTELDEILLVQAYTDVANGYFHTEEFEKCKEIFDNAYTKYIKWGTDTQQPYQYSKHHLNNGVLAMFYGDPEASIEHFRKSIAYCEMAKGPISERSLQLRFDLGQMLFHAGRLEESLDVNLKVLTDRTAFMGVRSSHTLMSSYTIASLQHICGNLDDAEKSIAPVLQAQTRSVLTPEELARTQYRLSLIYQDMGRTNEALDLGKQAIKMRDDILATAQYPKGLLPDSEMGKFDYMVSFWSGRFYTRLHDRSNGEGRQSED